MSAVLAIAIVASIDLASAQRAFSELDGMCARDAGRMWGRSLCGPTMLVERQTRDAVLYVDGKTTTERIPDTIGIANTSIEWKGRAWTMVMWPLPDHVVARRTLLAHESFHRIQTELGLPQSNPTNAHLDSAEARTLMRLEWRALARALASGSSDAVRDALAFRAQRRALTEKAAEEERLLEMNEGLAEYTGLALAVPRISERIPTIVAKLVGAEESETYARSFAYASGPAWGTLIEMKDRGWTRRAKASDDLGEIARRAWRIGAVPKATGDYDDEAIRVEEQSRAEKKRELLAGLRAKLIDGPILILPLQKMQFTFDPNGVQPLDDVGSVYRVMELRDNWGSISVTGGALISADWSRLVVPASGEGWTLKLGDDWQIVAGPRRGDKTIAER
jgi:hypothetical protein